MVADPWSGLSVAQVVEEAVNNASNLQFEDDFNQMHHKQQPVLDDLNSGMLIFFLVTADDIAKLKTRTVIICFNT